MNRIQSQEKSKLWNKKYAFVTALVMKQKFIFIFVIALVSLIKYNKMVLVNEYVPLKLTQQNTIYETQIFLFTLAMFFLRQLTEKFF